MKSEGASHVLQVADNTKIIIDGQATSGIDGLKEGQHVKAAFNDAGVLREMTVLSNARAEVDAKGPAAAGSSMSLRWQVWCRRRPGTRYMARPRAG